MNIHLRINSSLANELCNTWILLTNSLIGKHPESTEKEMCMQPVSSVCPEGGHYFMMWCVQMPACKGPIHESLPPCSSASNENWSWNISEFDSSVLVLRENRSAVQFFFFLRNCSKTCQVECSIQIYMCVFFYFKHRMRSCFKEVIWMLFTGNKVHFVLCCSPWMDALCEPDHKHFLPFLKA